MTLRERVTSKGGTTYAALTTLDAREVKAIFVEAMLAAQNRARELGDEFGRWFRELAAVAAAGHFFFGSQQ